MPIVSSDDPYAPFRPIGGRIVPLVVGGLCLMLFGVIATIVPSERFGMPDRIAVVLVGLALAGAMWRFAQVRAIPTTEGLEIHNLVLTRRLAWTQIVDVQFGSGAPWPTVELDDFDTVAVMGIQRTDGARAVAEAGRLAALVEAHSRPAADT